MKKINANQVPLFCFGIICFLSACQKNMNNATGSAGITTISTAVVTTVAGNEIGGNAVGGMTNGTGTAATFYEPFRITVDAQGNFYIADTELGLIRKMTSSFVVTALTGQEQMV